MKKLGILASVTLLALVVLYMARREAPKPETVASEAEAQPEEVKAEPEAAAVPMPLPASAPESQIAQQAQALPTPEEQDALHMERLRRALHGHIDHDKEEALFELSKLGESAMAFVPEMKEALKDRNPKIAEVAAFALAKIGPKAVEACEKEVVELLMHDNPEVKSNALFALSKNKDVALTHLEMINQQLHTDDMKVLDSALHAISMVGNSAGASTRPVTDLLSSSDQKIRQEAAFALGRIGTNAAQSVEMLAAVASSDPSEGVRTEASNALRLIHGGVQHLNENSPPEERAAYEQR